jgi:virulence factor
MRIAIVGLGNIAQKAYLPVVTALADIELGFCMRNESTLTWLSEMYRVTETVTTIDELLAKRVDAAFVHTATGSHGEVAGQLLQNGIHVYLDKPLAYNYEESRKLVELAEQTGRMLMVGFNRRFAPMYERLKEVSERRLVIMQKNRTYLPEVARRLVFDDFIHVVDTLSYLAPAEIQDVRVSTFKKAGQLHHVVLQLDGAGFTCIGLMNRDNGITEETLEVMSPSNKWVVRGLTNTVHYHGGEERTYYFNDWEPVLYRRGFNGIVSHFLNCVRQGIAPSLSARDSLATHELCERIVIDIEQKASSQGDGV